MEPGLANPSYSSPAEEAGRFTGIVSFTACCWRKHQADEFNLPQAERATQPAANHWIPQAQAPGANRNPNHRALFPSASGGRPLACPT